jgi:hypothetical protein
MTEFNEDKELFFNKVSRKLPTVQMNMAHQSEHARLVVFLALMPVSTPPAKTKGLV